MQNEKCEQYQPTPSSKLSHNPNPNFSKKHPSFSEGALIMPNYLTVKQMAAKHPAFSEASLRYHIFNETKNGIDRAIKRVGRKILINEERFFEWLENQNVGS